VPKKSPRKLFWRLRRQLHRRGFTLLEILVVVLVISIISAVAIPAIARTSPERKVELASTRLVAVLERMCEQAENDGRVLGLALSRKAYGVRSLRANSWQAFTDNSSYANHELEPGLGLKLWLQERESALPDQLANKPQLACAGSSEIQNFRLEIANALSTRRITPNQAMDANQPATAALFRQTPVSK
jgi:type II secretion system protein H